MMKIAFIVLFIVSMLAIGMSAAEGDGAKTIVETAAADGNFSTLVDAIETAGLTEILNGEGPFTVFAPTNEAFSALRGFDQTDMETLTEILKYHIAPGAFMAEDLVATTSIRTLQGGNLSINITDNGMMVNSANLTSKDIVCKNGIIHVIDAVMMPPLVERPEEERLEKERLEEERLEKERLEEERLEKERLEEERLEEERLQKLLKNVPPSQIP